MPFTSNFPNFLISLFLTFFIISCAQLQGDPQKTDSSKTNKQKVMEEKLEDDEILKCTIPKTKIETEQVV